MRASQLIFSHMIITELLSNSVSTVKSSDIEFFKRGDRSMSACKVMRILCHYNFWISKVICGFSDIERCNCGFWCCDYTNQMIHCNKRCRCPLDDHINHSRNSIHHWEMSLQFNQHFQLHSCIMASLVYHSTRIQFEPGIWGCEEQKWVYRHN